MSQLDHNSKPTEIELAPALLARLERSPSTVSDSDLLTLAGYIYNNPTSPLDVHEKMQASLILVQLFPYVSLQTRSVIIVSAFSHLDSDLAERKKEANTQAPDSIEDVVKLIFAVPEAKALYKFYEFVNAEPRYPRSVYGSFRIQFAGVTTKVEQAEARACKLNWDDETKAELRRIGLEVLDQLNGQLADVTQEHDDDRVTSTGSGIVAGIGAYLSGVRFAVRTEGTQRYNLTCKHSNYARKLLLEEFISLAKALKVSLKPPEPIVKKGLWQTLSESCFRRPAS